MKNQTFTQGISLRISAGFLIVISLIVTLTFVGLNHINQVNSQMKQIVETNNVKIKLAQVMQNVLQERALSMHTIAVLDDAFLKDDEYMRFSHLGNEYYQARKLLEKLIKTPEELTIFVAIRDLTRDTQPDVQRVVEQGLYQKDPSIFEKIRKQAIPKQRLIAEQVKQLVSLQQEQALGALDKAQSSYNQARNLMLLLGSLATILGILIATYIIKCVSKQARKLEHQALHDELTGLANRSLFLDQLRKMIRRGQRQSISFSIVLMDLNRFKQVNDIYGHQVGDLLLQEVARRLNKYLRKIDTVARLGGDEFVVILESLSSDNVDKIIEKLTKIIAEPFLLSGKEITIGSSMGIASYPIHGQDCITLINRADAAMYEAKRSGKAYLHYNEKTDYLETSSRKF